jgi:acetate kinase
MDTILVVNAGSSSVKFQVFAVDGDGRLRRQIKGQMDGIGSRPRLRATGATGEKLAERAYPIEAVEDVAAALQVAADWLRDEQRIAPLAVGHRVVHGGPEYDRPVLIDHGVVGRLERYAALAPLHQPHNLAPIRSLLANFPSLPQVACFDTAFHRDHGDLADFYAIPRKLHEEGVRRYGFHGLSYEYIASVLPDVAPDIAHGRVIVAHLGSGASLCAMKDRKSVDSTLGFTALDGLCMGTRPGAIDPGVVLYLFQNLGLTAKEVEAILYKKSGLLGISGTSNDMRDLLASSEPAARLAVDYFVYRAAKEIGALAAVLGGIDALVFTAGIGENSAEVRSRICAASAWLGLEMDLDANQAGRPRISRSGSRVSAWVIPTNEELIIARHTGALLGLGVRTSIEKKVRN